ncbi:16S rRNA (guanine(966)-N(2))-methyltransferase RsmD [Zavarzinia compransoris]|uniref:16S rRNA (Guanine(966)-N(2))-methyltransferase RsmD n=1 Tax=Zavarzinia compransoris TaxID=1264899 RepID=A0A317EDX8_9PROT|nr:16S rRNA (guanine(966)-N(2))-methyltransferase RsmD [Zavarzinia compransoris]PWR23553.1 16S rRNA (guanine(966)-N(2))-methyltransferase RsmD [Zavarzinia compransoris]TDP47765.1 16S rRNA (guanine966-N2)-methyltransferase [Zavarzinia compransoris]
MRIVAGRNKGRILLTPDDRATRPSADRLRESVFNILANRGLPQAAVVLDVFAGTGAMGLEAFSRGAARVVLIEKEVPAQRLIAENIKRVRGEAECKLVGRDAIRPGAPPPGFAADLVFLDPPYGKGLNEAALAALDAAGWLAPAALVVAEHEHREEPAWPAGFTVEDRRRYGKGAITVLGRD